jgi:glycosyltransferase involved in cell wall biosynthesis
MPSPTVSICIPAFNAKRYLAETLSSVRAQQFNDWELIVTEDGSDDGTAEIVDQFATTVTQPVRYERHPQNQGLPATRNTGIRSARAEWIALLDSDDLWEPTHLADLVSTARTTSAQLVHAGSVLFDSDTGRPLETRAPTADVEATFPESLFTARYIIQPASVLLHRTVWELVGGFNPAFRYVEDREMWMRCARAGVKFAYTGRETCRYRKHALALSSRSAEMAEAGAAVFDQHLDWEAVPADLRLRYAANTWAAAGRLRQRSQPQLAAHHFRRACAIQWKASWQLRALALNILGRFWRASDSKCSPFSATQ